jgi:hypothetical protein
MKLFSSWSVPKTLMTFSSVRDNFVLFAVCIYLWSQRSVSQFCCSRHQKTSSAHENSTTDVLQSLTRMTRKMPSLQWIKKTVLP